LIKLARDQKFHWLEPFAFARARARSEPTLPFLPIAALLSLLFALPLLASRFPKNVADLGLLCAVAVGSGALVAALMPLLSRLPNDVMVAPDRVVVGRTVTKFADIKHFVVGTMAIEQRQFPVFTFETKAGQRFIYGMSPKVSPVELANFLEQAGLREPLA
jgi:hypothetical protein